jgi:hypothetical protein
MQTFDLSYRFDPGHVLDGVTMTVPLHLLNQVDERRCEWLVPGCSRQAHLSAEGVAQGIAQALRAGAAGGYRVHGNPRNRQHSAD